MVSLTFTSPAFIIFHNSAGLTSKTSISSLSSGWLCPGMRPVAKKKFPQDDLLRLAELVLDVVPAVLKEQGKAKNPAPNVDAISGTLQYYYGVREFDFYTVLFGVGRALGVTANYVWARALGQPIERPKSMTTKMLEGAVQKSAQTA